MDDKNTFFPSEKKFKVLWNLSKTPLDIVKSSTLTEFHKQSAQYFLLSKAPIWSKNRQLENLRSLQKKLLSFLHN